MFPPIKLISMKLAIIISFAQFMSKDEKQFNTCELSTGNTVFLDENHPFKIGDTVLVNTTKYKDKNGNWKTKSSIVKVSIGQ